MDGKQKPLGKIKVLLICGLFLTITFSKLNLNSFCIILLAAAWLIEGEMSTKMAKLKTSMLFFSFALFSLLHFTSISYSPTLSDGWKSAESKLGFLVLPLILITAPLSLPQFRTAMLFFCGCMTAASVYCLSWAVHSYGQSSDADVFFYHKLVSPIKQHAIYFSVYLVICIGFLFFHIYRKSNALISNVGLFIWIGFLFLVILLLSSKMVLIVLFCFLGLWNLHRLAKNLKSLINWSLILVVSIIFGLLVMLDNPIKTRFTNLIEGNTNVLKQKEFSPGDYFNGAQFRLLLWRITFTALNENDAWVAGVSPAASQSVLQNEYRKLNLYTGDGKTNNGYLDYNCHNQFLQTTLQLGLVGLSSLIFLFFALARSAIRSKDPAFLGAVIIIFIFCFTESILERQLGMMLVAAIPLLFPKQDSKNYQ